MKRKINIHSEQLHLPFGQARAAVISYDHRKHSFWALTALSLLSLLVYVYAINSTARNVAERQRLEREVAELSAELGSLEFAYIERRNAITLEMARELGFSEVKSPLYVSRDSGAEALSFNVENR